MGAEPGLGLFVDLLGGFRVRGASQTLLDQSWGRRKARALVKLVALQPAHSLHRDAVLEALWPDLGVRAATNNLHKNLHHLRTALAERGVEAPLLELRDELLLLSPDVVVDADRFRAAATEALGAADGGRHDAAIALYRGDLLPEDAYEEWTLLARDELRGLYVRLLEEAADLDERGGRTDVAIDRLEELLRLEPTDEAAHRRLMRLHLAVGSRHRAMRQYERCREALERELGVEPSPETEEVYRAIAEGRSRSSDVADGPRAPRRETQVAEPPLGRERELSITEDAVEAALDGAGQILFVTGEAGAGKTHLLDAVLGAAQAAGATTLRAHAYEFDAAVPYQPIRDMLRTLLEDAPEPGVREILDHSAHLRRLSGDVTGPVPEGDADLLRAELFEQVTRLVTVLANRRPLVICFDNLHIADDATVRLLYFLARQIESLPVLLLVAYRADEQRRVALDELRAALRRDGRLQELTLQPLPSGPMQSIVERLFAPQPVEAALVEEVVQRAAGNPLFAHELAHTLVDEGRARLVDGRWRLRSAGGTPVPAAVRDLMERRLQRLGEDAQDELNAVAVVGREVDFATLRRMVDLPEREALDALDECLAAFILREAGAGYGFRHELLREAVYARLSGARRGHLHRRAAEAILASPGREPNAEDAGRHFALSDEPWRAVPYLVASGRRAAGVFANDHALDLYGRALDIAREHAPLVPAAHHAELLEELGDLRRRLGDADAGVVLFEEAAARFDEAGDSEGALRARGKAALGHIIRGDASAAAAHINAARSTLTDQSPDSVVSRTYYLLAQLHWHSGEHRQALEAAEQALLAADATDDPGQRAGAYEVLALACHSLGDWQRGVRYELDRQAIGVGGFDSDEAFDAHL